jgi:probable HAF family extracellular repeat protein
VGGFLTPDSSANHAFLYQDGAATDIHSLGLSSTAFAINERGTIVGIAQVKVGTDFAIDPDTGERYEYDVYGQRAFVHQNGIMTDLNNLIRSTANWLLDWAFDTNNSGQIVGYGQLDGQYRAYLLTPHNVPEPSSFLLLAVGLIGLAWWRRKQRGRARS